MEHVIALYLGEIWDKKDWIFGGQQGFRPGFTYESQAITVCQVIAGSADNEDRTDAIKIDLYRALVLVPNDRLLRKIAPSGVNPRAVVWMREFLLGRTQLVRVGGQLSEEVRVTSGVPQGSVLGPLLFLFYVNDI
jgi:hypothetical protein